MNSGSLLYSRRAAIAIIVILNILAGHRVFATHLRAADIQVERICGTLSFRITVIAYLNSLSSSSFGTNSEVIFGDGSMIKIPLTQSTPRPDLGENISVATFTVTHTYSAQGVFTITYIERDRSSGVLNIFNSHDVPYVTSVMIDMKDALGCNQYPLLTVMPLDRGCTGIEFSHNAGASDKEGDSISYQLSVPKSGVSSFAVYDDPSSPKFYQDYEHGNEAGAGRPVFSINAISGDLIWDAPGAQGEYNIAFQIVEWRKNASGVFVQLSVTTRDMQIVIEECENSRPRLEIPADLCVIAGALVSGTIVGTDAENDSVKIELFSEVLELAPDNSPAGFTPNPPDFVASTPEALTTFKWQTTCMHVRQQPYQVVVKITDKHDKGPPLVTFKTWSIRVIAPAPLLVSAALDVVKSHGVLAWDPYSCSNATTMEIWRKVDSFKFIPGNCQIGIPGNSGYQLIDAVDIGAAEYRDTNFGNKLSPAAIYCYRIVVRINGTKSIVSQELCIGPVQADAPIITHVSVEETATMGAIRVSWKKPMDINKDQFPEPYAFEIYRSRGFVGNEGIEKIAYVTDTTFVDRSANTAGLPWNYRIVLYGKPAFAETFIPIDTSAVASSVRLTGTSGASAISLHWQDSVPWSNVAQPRPYHLIYRAEGSADESTLALYDSVNVIRRGYNYIDDNVEDTELYTYRVVTRGTYGNPRIPLLQNSSQSVSLYPKNDLLPCTPVVILNGGCDDPQVNPCNQQTFTNEFSWSVSYETPCRRNIVAYNIYVSSGVDTVYTLLATVPATNGSFTHRDLSSPIRCYKVSSIDVLGTEGQKSEPACFDTCPFFELPNVFTPNNDGCNDLFSSRYDGLAMETNSGCTPVDPHNCPRFANSVTLKIFNRWGKKVYDYRSVDTGSVYIDWNGVDNNGSELATGIYYYVAEIEFETMDPDARHKTIKDWVHLVR